MQRLSFDIKVQVFKRMGYNPNDAQLRFHRDTSDVVFVAGGWRSGKSVLLAAETTPHCVVPAPQPYLIALIGPTYKEPRAEFDYIVDFLSKALPVSQFNPDRHVSRPRDGACYLQIPSVGDLHFATIQTFTAAEAENIRSFNAEGVVICEAGGIDHEAYQSIIGRVLSTGGFILGSGTMEASQKWYHNLIKEGAGPNEAGIKSFLLPSWENSIVFPGGRQDPKILRAEQLLDAETFAVRIGAQPIRVTGIALRNFTRDHIVDVQFDPDLPVELAIDPGYTGAYSVLAIQRYDNELRIIDEVYSRFMSTAQVIEECRTRDWWENVDTDDPGVIDRAAKQKQAATGSSVLDIWYEHADMWLSMTEEIIPVDDGLEQARNHLAIPGHIKVSPKCKGLIAEVDLGEFPEGFDNYEPWHYRADSSGRLQGDKALTGADHSCTALIYYLIHRFGYISMEEIMGFGPQRLMSIKGNYDIDETEDYGVEEITHTMERSIG